MLHSLRIGLSVTVCAVVVILLVSCRRPENVAAGNEPNDPRQTFASPKEAGAALLKAAESGDPASLLPIFGPDGKEVVSSGDPVKDKDAMKAFVAAYQTMNRWGKIKAGGEMLYIGTENFPFPIPLQENPSGRWYFNTAAGADEILARRIGRDELVAIAAISAIANAEQKYFSQAYTTDKVKQYAGKFISDEGKRNGLYWSVPEGHNPSPLGELGDFAKGAGYTGSGEKPQPFNGYYFRILTKQGNTANGGAKDYTVNGNLTDGFAILAYPEDYQNSGIMSFLVGVDGIVYQKDLGAQTVGAASTMTEYNPGDGWKPVE